MNDTDDSCLRQDASPAWRRALHRAEVLHEAGPVIGFALVSLAVTTLLARRFMASPGTIIGAFAALHLGVAGVVLVARARRRRWSDHDVATYTDRSLDAGGLYLTLQEKDDPRWRDFVDWKVDTVRPPQVAWHRPAATVAAAGAFLLVTFLLPIKPAADIPVSPASTFRIDRLEARLERLDGLALLDDAEERSMRDAIERLRERAQKGPATDRDREAIDELQSRLDRTVTRAYSALTAAASALAETDGAPTPIPEPLRRDLDESIAALDEANIFEQIPEDISEALMESWQEEVGAGDVADLDFAELDARLAELEELLAATLVELDGL